MVCESLARPGDARRYFEEGLQMARHLGDRRLEGQILGYLGLLRAKAGETLAAREDLARAVALLHALADQASLGIALCARAEVEHQPGDATAAAVALAEADAKAHALSVTPDSEFALALARAHKAVLSSG